MIGLRPEGDPAAMAAAAAQIGRLAKTVASQGRAGGRLLPEGAFRGPGREQVDAAIAVIPSRTQQAARMLAEEATQLKADAVRLSDDQDAWDAAERREQEARAAAAREEAERAAARREAAR